jgi:hypothetical protein
MVDTFSDVQPAGRDSFRTQLMLLYHDEGQLKKNLAKYALMIEFIEQHLNCKEYRLLCLDTVCFGIFIPYSGLSEKK